MWRVQESWSDIVGMVWEVWSSDGLVGKFLAKEDADSAVVAHNASDVRVRRKWQSQWFRDSWVACYPQPMPKDMPPFFSDDPDSCLVEAELWYRGNVENKPDII